ncbi:Ldh family oxidoreductase [Mesorhizobium sp. KR9-304]|uniref:Ldh family oxidoreductase n=1 Tax=Mesorhizobium sp. KR9-304 TaxID=3156614 RepID=UPI0032B5FB92
MADTVRLDLAEAVSLCERAAIAAGASKETAEALAKSSVAAQAKGVTAVGLSHFLDYLEALEAGRIDGQAEPAITRPALAVYVSDAKGGAAHTGFDRIFTELAKSARLFGVAIFAQRNAYTCGELGYFTGRLAGEGLVSFAATNGPALLAGAGGTKPVYCTNPISFAAPVEGGAPLVIDQASSATAFVSIRQAAEEGREIPAGWALDASGRPTTDPAAAMKGALLAFGGNRGANIALMVEVLAAGLSGANWSLDAPPFSEGHDSPGTGLFVLAIEPKLIDPDFATRLREQLDRLAFDYRVHIPGVARGKAGMLAKALGLDVPVEIVRRIAEFADRKAG